MNSQIVDGEEIKTDGEEIKTDGEEIKTDGEETEPDGEETKTDGEETESDGEEIKTDGEETESDEDEAEAEETRVQKPTKVLNTNKIFTEYYDLKNKWDNEGKRIKMKEKEIKEKKIKENKKYTPKVSIRKCVNCGKDGGTLFSNNKGILKAICNSSTPCNLNIELQRGNIVQLRDLEYDLHKKINEFKTKMITLKLNLLFGYQDEEKTIELFKENNKLLTEHEKLLYECHNYIVDITTDREKNEKEYNKTLKKEIEQIKILTNNFTQTKEPILIKDIINKYVDTIYPLMKTSMKTLTGINKIIKNVEETEMFYGDEKKVIHYSR